MDRRGGGLWMRQFSLAGSKMKDSAQGSEELGTTAVSAKTGKAGGEKVRAMLRARFGADVYDCWFHSLEFDAFDGRTVRASVPVGISCRPGSSGTYADGLLGVLQASTRVPSGSS